MGSPFRLTLFARLCYDGNGTEMAAWLAGGAVAHAVASPESRQWPQEIATSERPHISRVEASRASSTET
jgi:hypothetical protein